MPNDQLPVDYGFDPSTGQPLSLPVDSEPNPIAAKPYVMAPDLVGTQQQEQSLPVGYALNDAGIPFNIKTGKEDLPIIRRPSVLPIAKTPDGYTLAMPKVLDAAGSVMGPLAAGKVPLAAGEALLGSGAVRTAKEIKYPLANPAERWINTTGQNDHLLETMTPDEFLNKGRPLKIDAESRETINNLKQHIEEGKPLDPLELHANGKEDGRHRAIAAKELGIKEVPVINFREPEITPAFYSGLEKAVETAKPTIATADQWLGYLKNQPGVKSEELATVLKELPSGPITKEALGDIVKANKVELGEVVKKEFSPDDALKLNALEKDLADGVYGFNTKAYHQKFDELQELRQGKLGTKFHQYQLPGGPLSRDTEILTKDGWKRIDYVSIGEEIITRKDDNGELEWQPIQAIPTVYAEKLYHFYNQSIDMQVTANHKMVVRKRRRSSKGIFRITAEQLWATSECVIPLTGNWTGKGSKTLFGLDACDVAEFIGWYLAEGSYKHKNSIKNTIQIAQCRNHNPENCDRLEALFDRLGLVWKYYGNGYGIGSKSMNKELLQLLHTQPTSEGKFIPTFFFTQNKFVINALLDGLILGDGHTKEEGFDNYGSFRQARKIFFSKSKLLADGVQILALLSGYRASVRKRPTGIYAVGINSKDWNSVDDAKHAIVDYHDIAYCVTVENHCIYVRRNGVAAFTGNSDYKEMLLTLPSSNLKNEARRTELLKIANEYPPNLKRDDAIAELQRMASSLDKRTGKETPFKSSHWDEPNVLAHIRMNDRNVEGSKTLHLEEIQSDWHQKGRKEGYKLNPDEFDRLFTGAAKTDEKLIAANAEHIMGNPSLEDGLNQAVKENIIGRKEADDYIKLTKNENGTVPDAPFKKNWDELALKKMIHKAASEGYEGISWTPGEAQAARYDLSKSVNSIHWQPSIADKKSTLVQINPTAGDNLKLQVDKTGKIVAGFPSSRVDQWEGKNLADVIGKEHAEKILNKADGSLEGEGLKIGGEGMKSFYDKMLVDKANALAKKYGSKVEPKEISKGWDAVDANGKSVAGWDANTPKQAMLDWIKSMGGKYKLVEAKQPIHHLPLTPELKKKALSDGFPLFSSSPIITPVDHDPFEKKKFKLVPVQGNPFQ